jgi:mannose-6-phosphate isomerase-like protein (cupin superfamily)
MSSEGVGRKKIVEVDSGDVSPNKCILGDLKSVFHFGRFGESTPLVYLEKGAKEAVGSLEQPFG